MKWNDHFMNLAMTVANKSKDPSTKVGCVLVDQDNRVISMGFNGLPRHVDDSPERLEDREFKLAATLHAEANAILFAQRDLTGAKAYVWPMEPCAHCTALLIQAGVRQVFTQRATPEQRERWGRSFEIAEQLRRDAGVELIYHWGR